MSSRQCKNKKPPQVVKGTRFVKLEDSVMGGYLLSVLGTDQIHDFCGSRLADAKKSIVKSFVNENNNSRKRSRQNGGKAIIVDFPNKAEFIELQCLEMSKIFLDTLMTDGIIGNKLLTISKSSIGGSATPPENNNNNTANLSSSPSDNSPQYSRTPPSSESNKKSDISLKKSLQDETVSQNKTIENYESDWNSNYNKWYNNIQGQLELFDKYYNQLDISCYLVYLCKNDIRNIYSEYSTFYRESYKQKQMDVTFCVYDDNIVLDDNKDNIKLQHFYTLHKISKKYFKNKTTRPKQSGGESEQEKLIAKDMTVGLKKFIKTMAFKFCGYKEPIKPTQENKNVSNEYKNGLNAWRNWEKNIDDKDPEKSWEFAKSNWQYFEENLLTYGLSDVETASANWVKQQLLDFNTTSDGHKLENIVRLVNVLSSDKNGRKLLNCSFPSKSGKKHIINNAADISQFWESQVLRNYPSSIDSAKSGKDELDEKHSIYNCGFSNVTGSKFYKIYMNTSSGYHTIEIKTDKTEFKVTKHFFDDFEVDAWENVTVNVVLTKSFDTISSFLQKQENMSWENLISQVENIKDLSKNNVITDFYGCSLFKGLGDISQEMTSVIKYGGNQENSVSNIDGIENFDKSGNAFRFFVANDRLSANRFILTLNYGAVLNDNNINMKSYGGYFHHFGCKINDFYLVELTSAVNPESVMNMGESVSVINAQDMAPAVINIASLNNKNVEVPEPVKNIENGDNRDIFINGDFDNKDDTIDMDVYDVDDEDYFTASEDNMEGGRNKFSKTKKNKQKISKKNKINKKRKISRKVNKHKRKLSRKVYKR